MEKKLHNDKTGVDPKPYTALDELMLDIEGRDSNYMVGLGLDDSLSQFSNVSSQSQLDVTVSILGILLQNTSLFGDQVALLLFTLLVLHLLPLLEEIADGKHKCHKKDNVPSHI